jgi:hypothetical protein
MAAPAIPTNYVLQTANGQNLASWDIMAGATSYNVQRSTDGVTYASVATPSTPEYLDTSVTLGTQYWYKVAAVNTDGSSPYTTAQSCVPVTNGEACLSQIRLLAQQKADRVNSQFVTKSEWNVYINQSMFELYDLLVTAYGEEYFANEVTFTTSANQPTYALPNGINYDGAPAFYKLLGVDLGISNANNAYVTVGRYNLIDRNKFLYPNSASTIYGVFNLQYRLNGNNIKFIPTPSSGQPIRLLYIPRMTMLLRDTDTTTTGISGWWEFIAVDAAIKALMKEESDVSMLALQKAELIRRINASAPNRDAGAPNTISDTRSNTGPWGQGGWGGGPWGGM